MFSGTKLAPSRDKPKDMIQAVPQNLRWLKIAVIVLGIVLIAGTATVVITIFHRLGASAISAHVDVKLPRNAEVLESSSDRGRLLLRLKTDEGEEIRIFELESGHEIRRIRLDRTP